MAEHKITALIRTWLLPASVALATAAGAWARMELRLEAKLQIQQEVVRELRQDYMRTCGYGPSGFLDPAVHSAHDIHCQHWIESNFGKRGWQRLQLEYTSAKDQEE